VEFHEILDGYDALVEAVLKHSAEALLPLKGAEFESTGEADFGPVVINRNGLALNGKTLSWGEIKYAVSGGHLLVSPNVADFDYETIRQIPLADIYVVAMNLMERVGKPSVSAVEVYPKAMREFVSRRQAL
jgi:hypothetical protein